MVLLVCCLTKEENSGDFYKDEVIGGLPGQPDVPFKQFFRYITVDKLKGRSLFYSFVEAESGEATSKPLVLWMNGGPGMSSLVGALAENGPFGINLDSKTLHLRNGSWTRVANMLYIESPAGVGFSYSNTSADYNSTGDVRSGKSSTLIRIPLHMPTLFVGLVHALFGWLLLMTVAPQSKPLSLVWLVTTCCRCCILQEYSVIMICPLKVYHMVVSEMKLIISLLVCCIAYGLGDDGTTIFNPLFARRMGRKAHWVAPTLAPTYTSLTNEKNSADFYKDEVIGGLLGQPCVPFKQYSGYITVDELKGRSLFYYFVEAESGEATSKPLILWMNGGPEMSSLVGALLENGPFGINSDGKTLHLRNSSYTRMANMLYIESPAGVGFSYSNTSADYDSTGDVKSGIFGYNDLSSQGRGVGHKGARVTEPGLLFRVSKLLQG